MRYGEIIKRAWAISWRHKNLWWLGLFAGVGGGSYSFNNSSSDFSNFGSGNGGGTPNFGDAADQLVRWLPIIIAIALIVFVFVAIIEILRIAALGGLVSQVDVAERGGKPSALTGWGDGFHHWWRLAVVTFFTAVPGLVLALIAVVGIFIVVAIPLYAGSEPSIPALIALIVAFIVLVIVMLPITIVLNVMHALAYREVMLDGKKAWPAFTAAWNWIRSRLKDVGLMWLITVGFGIAYGLALLPVVLLFAVPFVGLVVGLALSANGGSAVMIVMFAIILFVLGVVFFTLLVVVGAAYATFHSALWTLFWRRLTGRDPEARSIPETVPTAPAYPPPPPPPGAPPAPPMAPLEGPPPGIQPDV